MTGLRGGIGFAASVIGISGMLALIGCDPCKREVWKSLKSPDGMYVAENASVDCGATTSEAVWLSVRRADRKAGSKENNFLVMRHVHPVVLSWVDQRTLSVDCDGCGPDEFTLKKDRIGSVKIRFEMTNLPDKK